MDIETLRKAANILGIFTDNLREMRFRTGGRPPFAEQIRRLFQ